nr:MAG TPA: hypothetical protein [Caudoviricetes sp.]
MMIGLFTWPRRSIELLTTCISIQMVRQDVLGFTKPIS